jgi:hypothetical protein
MRLRFDSFPLLTAITHNTFAKTPPIHFEPTAALSPPGLEDTLGTAIR